MKMSAFAYMSEEGANVITGQAITLDGFQRATCAEREV